jgi:glucose-1-phosphate thymidylyltransferase
VASGFSRKISMNLWRFDARIFPACADVPISSRGEFELPEAVALAIARGMRMRAIPAQGPVLDLSRRADAPDVARRLAGVTPCP